jgi:hypothetical protein
MAVQRVIPEGAFPPVRSRNGSALRQRPMPAPRSETSVAEEIELLPNDYQRALFWLPSMSRGGEKRWSRVVFGGSGK